MQSPHANCSRNFVRKVKRTPKINGAKKNAISPPLRRNHGDWPITPLAPTEMCQLLMNMMASYKMSYTTLELTHH